MTLCREHASSPSASDDGSIELTYFVEGTTDLAEAEGLAFAQAPVSYLGRFRNPIPSSRVQARGIFYVTFTYSLATADQNNQQENEPTGNLPTIGKLEIDLGGGTQHVTQCIQQKGYTTGASPAQIEQCRVVGLHKDGVNGTDIDVPGCVITLEKLWLPQAITGDYILGLKYLRGKVNYAPYTMRWGLKGTPYEMTFPAGELRYGGTKISTSITPRGITAWSFTYVFIQSNNRTNVRFGTDSQDIVIPFVPGHYYLWTMYEKKALTGEIKAMIEVPRAVFLSQMYEQENFVQYLGF